MPPLSHTALVASVILSALGAVIVCVLTALYGFEQDGEDNAFHTTRRRLLTRVGHAVVAACFAGTAILLAVVLTQVGRAASSSSGDARVPALDAKLDAHVLRLQGVEQRMKDSEETLQRLEMEVSEASARRTGQDAAPAVSEAPKPEEAVHPVSAVKPAPRPRAAIVPAKPTARVTPPAPKPEHPAAAIAPPPPVTPTERAVAPAPIDQPAASPGPSPAVAPSPAPARPSSSLTPASVTPAAPRARETPPGFGSKLGNDWRAIQRGWDNAGDDFRRAVAPLRGEN